MRLGIAIPRTSVITSTWTTLHLAQVALERGHTVRFVERTDFELDAAGHVIGRAHTFDEPVEDAEALASALQDRSARRRTLNMERLDLLLLRVAPPDPAVVQFATLLRDRGVPVVNDPEGLVRVSHKTWLAAQKGVPTPRTLVTRSEGAAEVFLHSERQGVIVKPSRGSGGRAITRVTRGSTAKLVRAFEAAKAAGDGYVVLQAYVPEAEHGEKRLVWLDGEIIGGYLRRRAPGEFRHNLKRGGTAVPAPITEDERNLAQRISAPLLAAGIRLAGLDVIGNQITEVNAANPGGTFHSDRLSGSRLAERIVEHLERTVAERSVA